MSQVVTELTTLADQHSLPRPADQSRHAMPPLVDPLAETLMEGSELRGKKSTLGAVAAQAAAPIPRRPRRVARILGAAVLIVLGFGLLLRKGLPLGASLLDRLRHRAPVVALAPAPVPAPPLRGPQALPPAVTPKPADPPVTEPAPPVSPTASLPKPAAAPKPGTSKPTASSKYGASKPKWLKIVSYKRIRGELHRFITYKLARGKR